jgi:hypothetical protein
VDKIAPQMSELYFRTSKASKVSTCICCWSTSSHQGQPQVWVGRRGVLARGLVEERQEALAKGLAARNQARSSSGVRICTFVLVKQVN